MHNYVRERPESHFTYFVHGEEHKELITCDVRAARSIKHQRVEI